MPPGESELHVEIAGALRGLSAAPERHLWPGSGQISVIRAARGPTAFAFAETSYLNVFVKCAASVRLFQNSNLGSSLGSTGFNIMKSSYKVLCDVRVSLWILSSIMLLSSLCLREYFRAMNMTVAKMRRDFLSRTKRRRSFI